MHTLPLSSCVAIDFAFSTSFNQTEPPKATGTPQLAIFVLIRDAADKSHNDFKVTIYFDAWQ
jgi:hypothetical protein